MAYNYDNPNSVDDTTEELLQKWNIGLNYQDIVHDADGLPNKKTNKLFQKCLPKISGENETPLQYILPIVIPKKELFTKPTFITERFSIRDTEPGYKLNMEEKYTPSYYFDPATRMYPKKFPPSVLNFNGKTVNLKKYGLNVDMTFNFMDIKKKKIRKGELCKS